MKLIYAAILLTLLNIVCHAQVTANKLAPSTFSNLGSPASSSVRYCTDCAKTTPCAGGGTGADAFRVNGVWECAAAGGGSGVTSITGTANQVIASAGTGAVTLSLPQSIATNSNVGFNLLTTASDISAGGSVTAGGTVTGSHLFMSNFLRGSEIAAPSLSSAGTARLYPDSTSHTWKVSNDTSAYFDLVTALSSFSDSVLPVETGIPGRLRNSLFIQGGDSVNPVLTFGAANSSHIRFRDLGGSLQVQTGDGNPATVNSGSIVALGSIDSNNTITGTHLFTTTGFIRMGEIAAPSVSSAGTARVYADSSFHTVRFSANGAPYESLVGSARQISTTLPLGGGGTLGADRTITCVTCAVAAGNLTNTALVAGSGGVKGLATPSTTTTLDSSGNIATRGTIQSGAVGVTTGAVNLAGSASGVVTIQAQDAAGTWTLKPPNAAGAQGQVLQASNDTGTTTWATAEVLLSTTAGVDWNVNTKSALYTVPAGKSAIVTRVIIDNASTSLTTASCPFGFNANADDYAASATYTALTGATLYSLVNPKAGAKIGVAADIFGTKCTIVQGGAATVRIRVFGFIF